MRRSVKLISVILALSIVIPSSLTGCDISFGDSIRDFFDGVLAVFRKNEPSDKAGLPDRPYILAEDIAAEKDLASYLAARDITAEDLLLNEDMADQLMAADSIEDMADSKAQVDNLKQVANELEVMENRLEDDPDSDPGLLDKVTGLHEQIEQLFAKDRLPEIKFEALTALMGTWSEPDKVILRWSPQMDWVPDEGYRLYRVLPGETLLLSVGLGNTQSIAKTVDLKAEFSEYLKPLFDSCMATDEVLKAAGAANLDELEQYIALQSASVRNRLRFSGAVDFERTRTLAFTISGTLSGRIPSADITDPNTVRMSSDIKVLPLSLNYIKSYGKLSAGPLPDAADDVPQIAKPVLELMQSRNDLLTKANTDIEFAGAAGFAYEDDLKGTGIAKSTQIEYVLVPQKPGSESIDLAVIASGSRPEGVYFTKVEYGVPAPLETPEGLTGYGADNAVYLRWTAPKTSYAKSIISGYYIERKLNRERKFTQLNDVPIAISYMSDEDGILYEMPAFYSDTDISNGDKARYRIRALDIFGRTSDYSEEVVIDVYKVTPPNTPNADQPVLSDSDLTRAADAVKEAAELNKDLTGIILPITKTSEDTIRFIVYRSKALGNGGFGNPEEKARIDIPEPGKTSTSRKIVRFKRTNLLINPETAVQVTAVYFDNDIEKGHFYKYWVAAADETGNESAWSAGRVIGYETEESPDRPEDASASFQKNVLPELVPDIPGFAKERILSESTENTQAKSDFALKAATKKVVIGVSLSDSVRSSSALMPTELSFDYFNLPDPSDIHEIIAIEEKDILSGGTARVAWKHFSGDGLRGYHVYRAYADGMTIEEISSVPRDKITQSFIWISAGKNLQQNLLLDKVEQKQGRIYLYLVFLVPDENSPEDDQFPETFDLYQPGGWVDLSWKAPDDPQLGYYRVYRSEVPYFTDAQDTDEFEWTMVADNLKYTGYSEKADQTYAHYYYYKITSVSIWGVESADSSIAKIRVASTMPPQTPSMLLPFAQKGKVKVAWAGVPHASVYTLYKTKLPKIAEEDIIGLEKISPDLFTKVFTPTTLNDKFLQDRMFTRITGNFTLKPDSGNLGIVTQIKSLALVSKFNTFQLVSKPQMIADIGSIKITEKLDIYKNIVDKYGILAVAPYGQLDIGMAELVLWDKVTEVIINPGEDSTGMFDFTDKDVEFGETYLYTVQAGNDDDLWSGRPDPVSVSPRRSEPFPPVTGLKGSVSAAAGNKPELTWNSAVDNNLTWKESREHIAGYIVYKSNTEKGTYYQASELLTDAKFIDRAADPYAANWYKVKVLDTGGFLSEFSEAVKIQKPPLFLIPSGTIKKLPLIPNLSASDNVVNLNFPIKPIEPEIPIIPIIPTTLTINGFTVTGLSKDSVTRGYGDGLLKIGDKFEADVTVTVRARRGSVITTGDVQLKQPVSLGDTGVSLSKVDIRTSSPGAKVSGYIKNPAEGQLIGDLFAITFDDAALMPEGLIKVTSVPHFHYDNLTFKGASLAVINPCETASNPALVYGSDLITLHNGRLENNLGMETLDNKGLEMNFTVVGFNRLGRLSGSVRSAAVQTIRTLVPAGLGIRITESNIEFKNGTADTSKSNISGKVILPFNTFEDELPVEFDPDLLMQTFSDVKIVSTDLQLHEKITETASLSLSLNQSQKDIVDRGMYYLASRIQSSSLKVLPMNTALLEKLSTVPFSVTKWSGKGFIVSETTMTPALVGNAEEEIGVTPGKVGLDLSKLEAYTGEAPEDISDKGWMGIVIKNGRVGLPPAFIKSDNNDRVFFDLTPGEMIYDRNGIFYQNQAYSAKGIPVNFGDSLGGFQDVIVNLIYLDMYNNKVNLEIQGEMGIPLFGYQRAKVRLYTSKELGKLVCSVAETDKFDPSGKGNIAIKIISGHLQKDGLHMDGTLDIDFEGKIVSEDMQFTELIIPADMEKMTPEGNPDELYGRALFDKAYRVVFHDFDMDLRALSFDSTKKTLLVSKLAPVFVNGFNRDMKLKGISVSDPKNIAFYTTDMTLWGGMQLSDNLTMDNNEDFDRIVIGQVFNAPEVSYEDSKSKLEFTFEDFASVKTVAVPVISESDGIVEYDTDSLEMLFNTGNSLLDMLPVEANVRMGYDKTMQRHFFAVGIYYHDPTGGIRFGIASMNDITGVIGYNLALPYDSAEGYSFPDSRDGFFKSVDELEVDRTPDGNYFMAATAFIHLGYDTGSAKLTLGEIRNVYFVVEKGPNIEMGGDYYGPASVPSIITGKDLKLMGTARLGYYHSERLFKFSLSLYDFGMYGCTVNGDLGFDMCPDYWDIRIGYPDMLSAQFGAYTGGFGFTIRDSDYPNDSYVKAQMMFGYDTGDVTLWPAYFRAYLYAGGAGEYYIDSGDLVIFVFVEGGLEGGIKVAGKKYRIIHMMVGADGTLKRSTGDWSLSANVRVRYHLDLFLTSVSGSVNWHVSTSF